MGLSSPALEPIDQVLFGDGRGDEGLQGPQACAGRR